MFRQKLNYLSVWLELCYSNNTMRSSNPKIGALRLLHLFLHKIRIHNNLDACTFFSRGFWCCLYHTTTTKNHLMSYLITIFQSHLNKTRTFPSALRYLYILIDEYPLLCPWNFQLCCVWGLLCCKIKAGVHYIDQKLEMIKVYESVRLNP